MECGICLELVNNSCIGSCVHHFCYNCMIKWCRHSNQCPKCRFQISEIRLDPEFDLVNGALNMEINIKIDDKKEKILLLPENTDAGITLKNNTNGPGVVISKIISNGQARQCDFKLGDIILFMNGVPCQNHKQCIDIINIATVSTKTVNCILL